MPGKSGRKSGNRLAKFWKEYVWTSGQVPLLTQNVHGLIALPGAEYYNLLFDPILIQPMIDKKAAFEQTVKDLKYKIDIDNPPDLTQIAPNVNVSNREPFEYCCLPENVLLLDIFLPDPVFGEKSLSLLEKSFEQGALVICNIVYAELVPQFKENTSLI